MGVHVSSVVFEVIRTILIFIRKDFERIKTYDKQNPINKTKISECKTTNATIFCAHKNF